MRTTGSITYYDGKQMMITPDIALEREILQKRVRRVELYLPDGREISPDQRRKIYAIIRDAAAWSGHEPEELKRYFKWNFCSLDGREDFSLSNVDKTTARKFISYLIEFCFYNSVPTMDSLLDRTDDIGKYLYLCLEHRKCAICNARADVHHVDRVGMGMDREEMVHVGLNAMALCREHHIAAHNDESKLFADYHIYGIQLDEYLCQRLHLRHKEKDGDGILKIPQ